MWYCVICLVKTPDQCDSISEAEKQSALDKKICREEKLQVIFNGVDIEAYENGVHGTVKRGDLNMESLIRLVSYYLMEVRFCFLVHHVRYPD